MTRLRGVVWLVAGVVLALLAGIVAFSASTRVAEQAAVDQGVLEPRVTVVVAGPRCAGAFGADAGKTFWSLRFRASVPAERTQQRGRRHRADHGGPCCRRAAARQTAVSPQCGGQRRANGGLSVDGQLLLALPAQDLLSGCWCYQARRQRRYCS